MSYCRWSSNNYQCDLYCYEDVSGGYTTHVATYRHNTRPEVSLEQIIEAPAEEKPALLKKYSDWPGDPEDMSPIGLPHDGHSFNDPDLESFLARVTMLRDIGYMVPDYVFERIKEEIDDQEKEA